MLYLVGGYHNFYWDEHFDAVNHPISLVPTLGVVIIAHKYVVDVLYLVLYRALTPFVCPLQMTSLSAFACPLVCGWFTELNKWSIVKAMRRKT